MTTNLLTMTLNRNRDLALDPPRAGRPHTPSLLTLTVTVVVCAGRQRADWPSAALLATPISPLTKRR